MKFLKALVLAALVIAPAAHATRHARGGVVVGTVSNCTINQTSPLTSATQASAFSQQFTTSNCGTPTYSFLSAPSPNGGSWLGMTSGGLLSGTPGAPAAGETDNMTVTATGSSTVSKAFSLYVNPTGGGGGGETNFLSYPSGFASAGSNIHYAWGAALQGSAMDCSYVAGSSGHIAGGCWYTTQANVTGGLHEYFTFQIGTLTGGGAVAGVVATPSNTAIAAFAVAIQNSNSSSYGPSCSPSTTAYGTNYAGDANMAGAGAYNLSSQCPMGNSVYIKFDAGAVNGVYGGGLLYPYGATAVAQTGLYTNFGPVGSLLPTQDMASSGINFYSGHVFGCDLTYDGSAHILTMVLTDTVTGAQFRTQWAVNIPAVTGSNNNWLGFTAGLGPQVQGNIYILTWNVNTGLNTRVATPSISPGTGVYTSSQTVSISVPTGSTVYYSTNGQVPSTDSTPYSGPFTVAANTVVQAIAVKSNYTASYVSAANISIQSSGNDFINIPNFSSSANQNLVSTNGSAVFSGGNLQLTDTGQGNEAGSSWFTTPVPISTFTTQFTLVNNGSADGSAFVIQNPNSATTNALYGYVSGGPNALAANSEGLGFGGITNGVGGQSICLPNSVAVSFDIYTGTIGLYQNCAGTPISLSGVNLASSTPIVVTLTYNGTTLSMTMVQGSNTFSYSWPVNIASVVNGSTAYVGFTAGTGGQKATQDITQWLMHP